MLIYLLLRQLPSWQRLNKAQRKCVYDERIYPALTFGWVRTARLLIAVAVVVAGLVWDDFHPAKSHFQQVLSTLLVVVLFVLFNIPVEFIWWATNKSNVEGWISQCSEKVNEASIAVPSLDGTQPRTP